MYYISLTYQYICLSIHTYSSSFINTDIREEIYPFLFNIAMMQWTRLIDWSCPLLQRLPTLSMDSLSVRI